MPSARDIPVLVEQFGSQDIKTVKKAALGLMDCLRNVANARSAIASAGGVTHILSAMRRFPTERKIQAFGCTLVNALLGTEATRAIVEQGGVPLVVAALDRYPNEVICRQAACRALHMLTSLDASTVVNAGAIPVMIKAVQRHPDDYGTVRPATACWAQLSRHRNSAHLQALMETVPVIICVLKQSCKNPQDVVAVQGVTSHPVAASRPWPMLPVLGPMRVP